MCGGGYFLKINKPTLNIQCCITNIYVRMEKSVEYPHAVTQDGTKQFDM